MGMKGLEVSPGADFLRQLVEQDFNTTERVVAALWHGLEVDLFLDGLKLGKVSPGVTEIPGSLASKVALVNSLRAELPQDWKKAAPLFWSDSSLRSLEEKVALFKAVSATPEPDRSYLFAINSVKPDERIDLEAVQAAAAASTRATVFEKLFPLLRDSCLEAERKALTDTFPPWSNTVALKTSSFFIN